MICSRVDKGSKISLQHIASPTPRPTPEPPTPALDLAFLLEHLRDWTFLSQTPEVG